MRAVAMNGVEFVKDLVAEIENTNFRKQGLVVSQNERNTINPELIKQWLNFAVYYERQSAAFVGGWLKTTPEDDAFHYFAHQVEDEANHYRWLKRLLADYVKGENNFVPPPAWRFLMEDYYPNMTHLVERLAAHNIASETGAIGFMEYAFDAFPDKIKEVVVPVMKDEKYHVSFGCKLLAKYCTTFELQERARTSAFKALEYMQKAREEFVNSRGR